MTLGTVQVMGAPGRLTLGHVQIRRAPHRPSGRPSAGVGPKGQALLAEGGVRSHRPVAATGAKLEECVRDVQGGLRRRGQKMPHGPCSLHALAGSLEKRSSALSSLPISLTLSYQFPHCPALPQPPNLASGRRIGGEQPWPPCKRSRRSFHAVSSRSVAAAGAAAVDHSRRAPLTLLLRPCLAAGDAEAAERAR